MITRIVSILLASTIGLAASLSGASAQERIKVGYWTSGFSVGFGAVLEVGKFLEAQGLTPEFVKFSDVNGPTKALITHSIDIAFAAPATGAFTLAAEGAPIEVVLATQVAEATFVSKDGSPIKSIADLKGKKVGMSPVGSATYAIAAAVLERNHGLKPADFTPIPGNEGRLVQFLQQGDIDAASLRAVTIASVPDLKLQVLGKMVDEWKRMTKTDSVPFLGVTIVHTDYSRAQPQNVVKFIKAMIAATKFGRAETEKASEILRQAANLDARDATAYVKLWDQIYQATFEPQDVATLKTMAGIFRANKLIEGEVPASLFATGPYEQAKQQP
jgi:ABC-type nitrate/sulfonate/bicarbonate transport system substrate-binding protein